VTAYTLEDALNLIRQRIFRAGEMPKIDAVVENVDVRDLDQGHVVPNMAECHSRGIWYPIGYRSHEASRPRAAKQGTDRRH
jgi:hypothetical protein